MDAKKPQIPCQTAKGAKKPGALKTLVGMGGLGLRAVGSWLMSCGIKLGFLRDKTGLLCGLAVLRNNNTHTGPFNLTRAHISPLDSPITKKFRTHTEKYPRRRSFWPVLIGPYT